MSIANVSPLYSAPSAWPSSPARLSLLVLLLTIASLATAHGQDPQTATAASPSAFVYLGAGRDDVSKKIPAYAVAANGSLTHLQDAAGPDYLRDVVSTNSFVFATSGSDDLVSTNIHVFRKNANGTLTYLRATNTAPFGDEVCSVSSLALDHTGTTLYANLSIDGLCEEASIASFSINPTTGALTHVGTADAPYLFYHSLSFLANNDYAYGAICIDYKGGLLSWIPTYKRVSGGALQFLSEESPTPPLTGSDVFCSQSVAPDPANHVAIALQEFDYNDPSTPIGPARLATYTADSAGNLTTASTVSNMPSSVAGELPTLAMSPTGKFLAASGQSGLQLFRFNDDAQATQYSNLLTSDEIDRAAWDKANHLYALSLGTSHLHVYTVTSASVVEAPGSPYAVAPTASLDVLTQGSQLADVIPTACSATTGAKICSPGTTASLISPAFVSAAATASTGYITAIRLYVDSVAQTLVNANTKSKSFSITQALAVPKGAHTLTVVGYQNNGSAVTANQTITIK